MVKVELNDDAYIIATNQNVKGRYPQLYKEVTSCPLPYGNWWNLSDAAYSEYERYCIDENLLN